MTFFTQQIKKLPAMLMILTALTAIADDTPPSNDSGIWKAVVPKDMRGEFDSEDVIGIVAGAHIKADCSINWKHPDDGKIYCFSSGTSLIYFQEQPNTYIAKARKLWKKEAVVSPSSLE